MLGALTGALRAWPGAGLIDPSRMAMAGHSAGGAAAIATMLADSRIRAGIDMDGATVAPIPDRGLSRPFLFLGKRSNYAPTSRYWPIGIGIGIGAGLPGSRSLDITRAYVRAFFRPAPAEQATSAAGPAVTTQPRGHLLFSRLKLAVTQQPAQERAAGRSMASSGHISTASPAARSAGWQPAARK